MTGPSKAPDTRNNKHQIPQGRGSPMHAPKAPPSRLASVRPCLVPQTSHRRASVVDAVADEGAVQRTVGSIPQNLSRGVDVGRPFLVVRYGWQSAARAAKGKARA